MKMSFSRDKTAALWQKFMPRRAEVGNRATSEYISMQIFEKTEKNIFSATALFEKWATVEVSTFPAVPSGMESYSLQGGKYAVFIHNGPANAFARTMRHIFGEWLPNSAYERDNREHFEILPEDYSPVDPNAKEEVWVPIKP